MFLGQSEGLVDSTTIKSMMIDTYGQSSKCFHHYMVVRIDLLIAFGILKDIRFTGGVEHIYDLERFQIYYGH